MGEGEAGEVDSRGKASGMRSQAVPIEPPQAAAEAAGPAEQGGRTARLVVREGESPWTDQEMLAVREELTVELDRIAQEVVTLESSIADVMRSGGDGAGDDQADTGSKAFEREQGMTLLASARENLFQTEHALSRMDKGRYGICESCGGPIGKLRLQAFPRATLCVACKQREERR